MLRHRLSGKIAGADDDVRAVERGDERRRERGIVLPIRIDRENGICSLGERGVESRPQCRALAAILVELDGFCIGDGR